MNFIKWCDNHKWTYATAILSFIIVPVFVEYSSLFYGHHHIKGDWLSFWGSYLGIIPSGLIAYLVTKYQIGNEKIRQQEQFDHNRHIENLTNISKKLRKLDPIFEYGVTHQYLFKDEAEAEKYFDASDGLDLKNMMGNLINYMLKGNIFQKLAILILDIDMMPKVRGTSVSKRINELNNEIHDLSAWFSHISSGEVQDGEGKSAYVELVGKYKKCNDTYHRALKQIADEIYPH